MLRNKTFWGSEKEAPLLKLNRGYLQSQGDLLYPRVNSWLKQSGVTDYGTVSLVEVSNPDRIFVADAERTFRDDVNRARFVRLLAHLAKEFGDYAQGLSYVASFLSLTMPESEVVALITQLNNDEKYVPGYWKHEAIKFATDAYVFQELANKFVPKASAHLIKNCVDPSSYCQKWFVGLCVHVLPFEYLFQYFEGFLKGGHKFLMQFGLSLLRELQDKLLAVHNNPSVSFGLLRLDPSFIPHDDKFDEMIKRVFVGTKDFNLDDINFKELREQAYNKNLKARIESAKIQREAKDSDDEIEDCPLCNDDLPELYCKECKLKVSFYYNYCLMRRKMCESCHEKPPADSKHLRSHKVKPLDEDEEEEEEEEEKEKENGKVAKKGDDTVDKLTSGLQKLNV